MPPPKHRIRFLPDEQEVEITEGTTLLEAAREANVYVGGICGGEGVCGKCRVIVKSGEFKGESIDFLSREEIRQGYALACQIIPKSDIVAEVPPESRLGGYRAIGKDSDRFRDFAHRETKPVTELDPLVRKVFLELPEPTLDNAQADHERLLDAVRPHHNGPLQMGLKIARELPTTLRELDDSRSAWEWKWDGRVTATVGSRGDVGEVLFAERGDTSDRNFGLALDIGTTTLVAHLVDLTSGVTREASAKYNSQIDFGGDVISRVNYARRPGGADELRKAVAQDVNVLVEDLADRAHIGRRDITCVVVSGNTTMLHLLLCLEADLIRLSPFVPAATCPPPLRAAEIGIGVHPRALLFTMPMVGSYVGGDITAGILASGIHEKEEISLLLDIGTNGEVVLGCKDFLVACSASAGPAFEGGQIKCGMRATAGAIDTVRIFQGDLTVSATTIDSSPPVGLCGTGLIDVLSEMLLAGLVDRNGQLQTKRFPERFRTSPEDEREEFVLVEKSESGGPRDVVISQADVDNLIRTKGAIYAAADSLVTSLGLDFDSINEVYIAGAFGNVLDVVSCINIGLLPDIAPDKINFIGNSSILGSKLAMRSRKMCDKARSIRDSITYQEMMVDPGYMDKFTSACFLPHTDMSRFPSVQKKLSAQKKK